MTGASGHYTRSKSRGPLWSYFVNPIAARGFLSMKRTICQAMSLAPSFFLGKGSAGMSSSRNLCQTLPVKGPLHASDRPAQHEATAQHSRHRMRASLVPLQHAVGG